MSVVEYLTEEVLTTETRYVTILESFYKYQVNPLTRSLYLFTPNENEALQHLSELAKSLENLIILHKSILRNLSASLPVIKVLCDHAKQFEVFYTRFVNYTEHCNAFMNKSVSANPMLKNWLGQVESKTRQTNAIISDVDMTFSSCCIQPIQRLMKYKMFLLELKKHSEGEAPGMVEGIQHAINSIGDVLTSCNEQKRKFDAHTRVFAIQQQYKVKDLAVPKRYVVREGPVESVELSSKNLEKKPAYAVLFNDIFIVIKLETNSAKRVTRVSNDTVISTGLYTRGSCAGGNFFFIMNDEGNLVMGTTNAELTECWIEDVQSNAPLLRQKKRERPASSKATLSQPPTSSLVRASPAKAFSGSTQTPTSQQRPGDPSVPRLDMLAPMNQLVELAQNPPTPAQNKENGRSAPPPLPPFLVRPSPGVSPRDPTTFATPARTWPAGPPPSSRPTHHHAPIMEIMAPLEERGAETPDIIIPRDETPRGEKYNRSETCSTETTPPRSAREISPMPLDVQIVANIAATKTDVKEPLVPVPQKLSYEVSPRSDSRCDKKSPRVEADKKSPHSPELSPSLWRPPSTVRASDMRSRSLPETPRKDCPMPVSVRRRSHNDNEAFEKWEGPQTGLMKMNNRSQSRRPFTITRSPSLRKTPRRTQTPPGRERDLPCQVDYDDDSVSPYALAASISPAQDLSLLISDGVRVPPKSILSVPTLVSSSELWNLLACSDFTLFPCLKLVKNVSLMSELSQSPGRAVLATKKAEVRRPVREFELVDSSDEEDGEDRASKSKTKALNVVSAHEDKVATLVAMGFDEAMSRAAVVDLRLSVEEAANILSTGGSSSPLPSVPREPPIPVGPRGAPSLEANIITLMAMGFAPDAAKIALQLNENSIEKAMQSLMD